MYTLWLNSQSEPMITMMPIVLTIVVFVLFLEEKFTQLPIVRFRSNHGTNMLTYCSPRLQADLFFLQIEVVKL